MAVSFSYIETFSRVLAGFPLNDSNFIVFCLDLPLGLKCEYNN